MGDAGPAGRQSTNDKLLNQVTSNISPEACEAKYDKMKTAFKVSLCCGVAVFKGSDRR